MELVDSFTGAKQRRDIGFGNAEFNAQTKKGLSEGLRFMTEGRDNALSRFDPYSSAGARGFDAYANAVGANGLDAQQGAFEDFQSNPFLQFANQNTENAIRDTFRAYNAVGQGNSGDSRAAVGEVAGRFARQDINDYINRLMGLGSTGLQAAGAQSNIDYGSGNALANFQGAARSALGNQGINYGNALAGSRTIGINNLMNLAQLPIQAYAAANGIPPKVS